jgi:uncharacterized protein (DUF2147 family)
MMFQADRWRRPSFFAAAFALPVVLASSAISAPTPPDGIWYTKNDESIIKVKACETTPGDFCGQLVWLKEPNESDGTPKLDKLNKDPAKRSTPLIGLEILVDMGADGDHWTGKAYNPDDGKLYDITFRVKTTKEPNDQADLRGCVLGFLCQTETFTRANEVPGGDPTATADATPAKKHKGAKKESAHK